MIRSLPPSTLAALSIITGLCLMMLSGWAMRRQLRRTYRRAFLAGLAAGAAAGYLTRPRSDHGRTYITRNAP